MFVELHILQNFAPANLNRDDTGSPKDCEFGGVRRARISSQCLKRAIRAQFDVGNLFPGEQRATRTKRLIDELVERLGRTGDPEAPRVVQSALEQAGFGVKSDGKTEYLLFLAADEIERLAALCRDNWDALAAVAGGGKGGKKGGDGADKPTELRRALRDALGVGKAVDLALFGRMLADLPEKNVDAASQVAHALSTNRVSMEFDFYTAVDDLKPDDTAGADMIGTVEFNSACFYRYANVDADQLRQNLRGDAALARKAVAAFVEASVKAVPTGKQNSMAAQNPPALVFAVVRERGLWSLANAFVKPVRPSARPDGEGDDLVEGSIAALDRHWAQLARMYGAEDVRGWVVALDDGVGLPGLTGTAGVKRVPNIAELVAGVRDAVAFGQPVGAGR
jgi:CRISPR system Cascade subunit CasC